MDGTTEFVRDSQQLISMLDGEVTPAMDLANLLRNIAEEFVQLHTEREVLYLRSELVSVLDRRLSEWLRLRGETDRSRLFHFTRVHGRDNDAATQSSRQSGQCEHGYRSAFPGP